MNFYFSLMGFSNGLCALIPALYVYFKGPRKALETSFIIYAVLVAFWSVFLGISLVQATREGTLFYMRLLMIGVYALPFSFLAFAMELTAFPHRRRWLPLIIFAPAFFIALSFSDAMVADVVPKMVFPYWPNPGRLMHVQVLIFFAVVAMAFVILFRAWSRAAGDYRKTLKWVTWVSLFGWAGGSTNYFLWYDIPVLPVANVFVSVTFMVLAYCIMSRRLLDMDLLPDVIRDIRLSMMGVMAASLSHSIKNSLYAAQGLIENHRAQCQEARFADPQNECEHSRIVLEKTLGQITRVFDVLRDYSERARKLQTGGEAGSVKLNEIFERAIALALSGADELKIQVVRDYPDDLLVSGHAGQLEEIFYNLLANAREAMTPGGGTVTLSARTVKDKVEIRVEDNGPGIPAENMERIFEPFFSTKSGANQGLGLYIVRQLVLRHHGEITMKSCLGGGVAFIVKLASV